MAPKIKAKAGFKALPDAAAELNIRTSYLRTLLREGKVEGAIQRPLNPRQWRWEIPQAWIDARKASRAGSRTKREDGRNKFLVWMTPSEHKAFEALMKEHMPDVPYESSYKPKDENGEEWYPDVEFEE